MMRMMYQHCDRVCGRQAYQDVGSRQVTMQQRRLAAVEVVHGLCDGERDADHHAPRELAAMRWGAGPRCLRSRRRVGAQVRHEARLGRELGHAALELLAEAVDSQQVRVLELGQHQGHASERDKVGVRQEARDGDVLVAPARLVARAREALDDLVLVGKLAGRDANRRRGAREQRRGRGVALRRLDPRVHVLADRADALDVRGLEARCALGRRDERDADQDLCALEQLDAVCLDDRRAEVDLCHGVGLEPALDRRQHLVGPESWSVIAQI